jgi:hypothetical protein
LRIVPGTGGDDTARRALLGPDAFKHVIAPLVGRRVGYVRPVGHVGYALIELAMTQLFAECGIRWLPLDLDDPAEVDVIVFGGGGSMAPGAGASATAAPLTPPTPARWVPSARGAATSLPRQLDVTRRVRR